MAQLSDLPSELKLLILQHCSLKTYEMLSLVSKEWRNHVLDKPTLEIRVKKGYYRRDQAEAKNALRGLDLFNILLHYQLAALEEWALKQEPEGEALYTQLQAIHYNKSKNHQEILEALASNNAVAARLILYHQDYWGFIENRELCADFIQNIAGKWSEAIYYALENKALQKKWLPTDTASYDQKYEVISNTVNIGGIGVAWLWSTRTELYRLLASMKDDIWWLSICISAIIEVGGQEVALLWSTEVRLLALLEHMAQSSANLTTFLRTLMQVGGQSVAQLWSTEARLLRLLTRIIEGAYPSGSCLCICTILETGDQQVALLWCTEIELLKLLSNVTMGLNLCVRTILQAGGPQAAKLWSTKPNLRKLLTTHMAVGDSWELTGCILDIIETGDQQVALLWSTETEFLKLIAGLVNSLQRTQCIRAIIARGGPNIALLWSETTLLRNIIANIENAPARLDCIELLIRVGGEAAQKACLAHPTLARDLASMNSGFSRLLNTLLHAAKKFTF